MGLSDIPANYMQQTSHNLQQQQLHHHHHNHNHNHNAAAAAAAAAHVLAMENSELLMSPKDKMSSKKKMHLLKKIKKRFGLG